MHKRSPQGVTPCPATSCTGRRSHRRQPPGKRNPRGPAPRRHPPALEDLRRGVQVSQPAVDAGADEGDVDLGADELVDVAADVGVELGRLGEAEREQRRSRGIERAERYSWSAAADAFMASIA